MGNSFCCHHPIFQKYKNEIDLLNYYWNYQDSLLFAKANATPSVFLQDLDILFAVGNAHFHNRMGEQARQLWQEGHDLAKQNGDLWRQAKFLSSLGLLYEQVFRDSALALRSF